MPTACSWRRRSTHAAESSGWASKNSRAQKYRKFSHEPFVRPAVNFASSSRR